MIKLTAVQKPWCSAKHSLFDSLSIFWDNMNILYGPMIVLLWIYFQIPNLCKLLKNKSK